LLWLLSVSGVYGAAYEVTGKCEGLSMPWDSEVPLSAASGPPQALPLQALTFRVAGRAGKKKLLAAAGVTLSEMLPILLRVADQGKME
jgi:hypothetical protein